MLLKTHDLGYHDIGMHLRAYVLASAIDVGPHPWLEKKAFGPSRRRRASFNLVRSVATDGGNTFCFLLNSAIQTSIRVAVSRGGGGFVYVCASAHVS